MPSILLTYSLSLTHQTFYMWFTFNIQHQSVERMKENTDILEELQLHECIQYLNIQTLHVNARYS